MTQIKIKLAIDARPAQGRASGVVTYTRNIIRALPVIADRFDFFFITDQRLSKDGITFPDNAVFINTSVGRSHRLLADVWTQFALPRILTKAGVDVFHQPDYLIPVRPVPFILVASYLDAIVFTPDDNRSFLSKKRVQWLLKRGAKNADAIVTISEFSRSELIRYLEHAPSQIVSIWCGVTPEFFIPPDNQTTDACIRKLDTRVSFILYYGGFSKRKNVPLLLQAFKHLACGNKFKLVIAGDIPPEIRDMIRTLRLEEYIILFGYATDEELRVLLRRCDLFVFPSDAEGFGLPVAEAMACGTAIVCSANGSLPEIAGNGVLYFQPSTPENLAATMENVLADECLRRDLQARALRHAQRFDWTKAVQKLGALYLRLLGQKAAAR
ncbi:MAG: glycosyltransferase family 1 protein [Smithellaceae bacterium]